MSTDIVIVAYDPTWPDQFAEIAAQIAGVTAGSAQRVDHIGSTSVPDLAAKDIIDIQVTVTDLDDEMCVAALEAAGFRLRSDITRDLLTGTPADDRDLQKRFLLEPVGSRRCNVHVREAGRLNQQYPLLFRDFLKSDTVVREAYATIKQELASHFPNDVAAYYRIKDPLMDTIYRAALLWARQTDWKLGT